MRRKCLQFTLLAVLSITMMSCAILSKDKGVYYSPIQEIIKEGDPFPRSRGYVYRAWDAEAQKELYRRAEVAARMVTLSLFASDIDIEEYRRSIKHDRMKEQLQALVDNVTAWPEYIYIARFVDSATKYQILCSSSDIIEREGTRKIEINENMIMALDLKKPFATDLFSPFGGAVPTHAADYYPFFAEKEPVGILVFVKRYLKNK